MFYHYAKQECGWQQSKLYVPDVWSCFFHPVSKFGQGIVAFVECLFQLVESLSHNSSVYAIVAKEKKFTIIKWHK